MSSMDPRIILLCIAFAAGAMFEAATHNGNEPKVRALAAFLSAAFIAVLVVILVFGN